MKSLERTGGRSAIRRMVAASVLVCVPGSFLLILGIAEMAGGEFSGVQHLIEGGVLLVIIASAWRYPMVAGRLLIGLAVVLFVAFLVFVLRPGDPEVPDGAELVPWAATIGGLFLLPFLAGWLILRASK